MARFFVPNLDRNHNLEGAYRYGEIRIIHKTDMFPDEVDDKLKSFIQATHDALLDFDPINDYICLSGSPFHIAMCMLELGRMFPNTRIRTLRYDRMERGYYFLPMSPIEEMVKT